jgi:hypothetical protein
MAIANRSGYQMLLAGILVPRFPTCRSTSFHIGTVSTQHFMLQIFRHIELAGHSDDDRVRLLFLAPWLGPLMLSSIERLGSRHLLGLVECLPTD